MADEDPPAWVKETQVTLGKLIKRPKLTDALLKKPPFRFLHDIVTEVTKTTSFGDGLYSGDELASAKIKDKDGKINYLMKIVDCVSFSLNTPIDIRPSKVVAGLEPENTNKFLQLLAQAATTAGDAGPQAVARVLAGETSGGEKKEEKKEKKPAPKPAVEEPAPALEPAPTPTAPEPAPEPKKEKAAKAEQELQAMQSADPEPKPEPEEPEKQKQERPRTARRAPPKLPTNEVKVDAKEQAAKPAAAPGLIMEGMGLDDEDDVTLVDDTGAEVDKAMLNDPSGEGHGKLVKNILETKNEMEASEKEEKQAGGEDGSKENGAGIILGRSKEKKDPKQSKSEMVVLRQTIQALCQSSNPLGKCLEFVQEDMEAMVKELEQCRSARRRHAAALAEEEAATEQSLRVLHTEMAELESQIEDQSTKIRNLKANIIRNDATVEKLLRAVVTTH